MNVPPLRPVTRPLDHVLRAVPSKSVTHRALVAAALARGTTTIRGPLVADDTEVTRKGLAALGVRTEREAERWTVHGCAGALPGGGRVELLDSGTSARFLSALATLGARPTRLDGSARLRQRPLGDLVLALERIGARVEAAPSGGLPLTAGGQLPRGDAVRVAARRSSQFASALLLVAARLPRGLDLTLAPPAVSLPYVELTQRVLQGFGVPIERRARLHWRVPPTEYAGRDFPVEGDHSSASYFLVAPAIAGGRVRVEGLDPTSAQPDARLGALLERMGCRVARGTDWVEVRRGERLRGLDEDLGEAPDLVPTLAALAMFAEDDTTLRGLGHLRDKESDRLQVLADNLRRLGCEAVSTGRSLEVRPAAGPRGGTVRTASDHRIAMAFAVAGLAVDGIRLDDAACVAKSNPLFWRQLAELRVED